jgi:ABC-type uncharacterized transport system permease subunit
MRDLLRAYCALVRATWSLAFTYRAQVALWLLGFVFPFVMLALGLTVEAQTGLIGGFDRAGFVSYYVAAAAVLHLTWFSLAYFFGTRKFGRASCLPGC